MIIPNPKDAVHKAWLYRLLSEIYDDSLLANTLYFKGGTCAAMLGYLDRFSVDLDFDLVSQKQDVDSIQKQLEIIFKRLDLTIKDKSKRVPQYFLKYPSRAGQRNTLKIDVTFPAPKANQYAAKRFTEIDRIITCQTIETMFANKLVALKERYDKNNSIAGRDLYDIHHFFFQGFRYNEEVIRERTKKNVPQFFKELIDFIEKEITEVVLSQDLGVLLPYDKFRKIRRTLKQETLMFLRDELERVK